VNAAAAHERRYAIDWPARARIDGAWPWRPCRVVLISTTGATVELSWSPEEDVLAGVLDVRARASSSSHDELQFEGEIVEQQLVRLGVTRVRVRFVGARLQPEELLELLLRLRPD
jgi:hypothetical protein